MNIVFSSTYPTTWNLTKMFVIFKKGLTADTNNYRGISVVDALPKLYDGILNARLNTWYTPCIEQAGAQAGRGCEEQLVTLRLYIDIAKKKRYPLYIVFIDYVKAYDKVCRNRLLQMLCDYGCGDKFIRAIGYSLKDTFSVIGNTEFKCTSGVKQGSATSCNLFTFYLDHTVRAIRTYGPDGFLEQNHMLLLMDDTVLLATSRAAKLVLLYNSTLDINMTIHPDKSKYIVVNCEDSAPFKVGNATICHTEKYIYLGTPISAHPIGKQVEDHIKSKQGHICKFQSFVHRNQDAPYMVKHCVLQAAVNSAILYSCESWLSKNLKCVDTAMEGCLKSLLGVRNQTSRDLLYAETGSAPASSEVKLRQVNFFKKLTARGDVHDYPVGKAMLLARAVHSSMGVYIDNLDLNNMLIKDHSLRDATIRITTSTKTRMLTYKGINSDLSKHPIYGRIDIPEYARINFTRLRLSSHYLRIETGRWSRLKREDRKCVCGEIKTEEHILLHCPETAFIQDKHQSWIIQTL